MAFFAFVSMPILYYLFDINKRWQLPLAMKIIGIDNDSHPGYEIHYAFCVISILYGAIVIGGIM